MIRILFLILWILGGLGVAYAQGNVEIYVNGHKFDSFKAYLASKKNPIKTVPTPVALDKMQEEYIRQEAQKLGINIDFGKVKTFQVNNKSLSDKALHKLYVLSVEKGVVGALQDFYQSMGSSGLQIARKISTDQLQDAIAQAVTTSNDPKLVISEPGKVRIMALTTDESDRSN